MGDISRTVKKQLEHLYDDVKSQKQPETLWDLESEKEKTDKAHGYWRGKREMIDVNKHIPRVNNPGEFLGVKVGLFLIMGLVFFRGFNGAIEEG